MIRRSVSRATLIALGTVVWASACNSADGVFDGRGAQGGEGAGSTASGGSGGGEAPLATFETLWATRYASPEDQRAAALAINSSGASVVVSLKGMLELAGTPYVSAGNADVLLVQVEPLAGEVTKVLLQGDASLQEPLALAVSPQNDDIALGGSFNGYLWNVQADGSDAFTALIRPDTTTWLTRRQTNQIRGTAFDDANRVVAVGDFEGTVDTPDPDITSAGGLDGCVYWFTNNGGISTAAQLGSTEADALVAVATDDAGNVYAAGYASGPLVQDPEQEAGGGADVLVASWDGSGVRRFARLFGDGADQTALDVAIDPSSGELVVVGSFEGTLTFGDTALTSLDGEDAFVARFAEDGSPIFALALGGPSTQRAQSVAIDGTGRIIVAGDFEEQVSLAGRELTSAGKSDIFLAAFDEDGEPVALQAFGDDASQYAEDIAVDDGDHVYLAASVQGELDLGTGPLTAEDTSFDLVIARFAP